MPDDTNLRAKQRERGRMGIRVDWYNKEHTVIYWQFEGRWTWDEFAAAQKIASELLQNITYQVDIIGNLQQSAQLPTNALSAYTRFAMQSAENTGLIVLVGSGAFIKTLTQVFKRIMPGNLPATDFVYADTNEAAYALILAEQKRRA